MVQSVKFSFITLAALLCAISVTACQSESTQPASQTQSANNNDQAAASHPSLTPTQGNSVQTASTIAMQANAQRPEPTLDIDTTMPVTPLPKALFSRYATNTDMVKIESGSYRPLYLSKDSPIVQVRAFKLDKTPVTNAQFYQFVQANPKWQKQNIAKLFTEADYLKHWQKNTQQGYQPVVADLQKPVVYVSWYAANEYCQAQGKKLPTVAQWEYVAQASETRKNGSSEKGYNQKILAWYGDSAKKPLTDIAQDKANFWGVHNMHGLIWEWTDDFNSNLVTGESRSDGSLNQGLFCGSGAAGAVDPSDYAAFMRYGFRSSLASKFALSSLGFRCAKAED